MNHIVGLTSKKKKKVGRQMNLREDFLKDPDAIYMLKDFHNVLVKPIATQNGITKVLRLDATAGFYKEGDLIKSPVAHTNKLLND